MSSFSSSLSYIKVRVSRFELFPKDVPREYKVGFVVTHTRNKTSRYFEGILPFSQVENEMNEEELAVLAWSTIQEQVALWYKNNKGIVGYTFDIPEHDFEAMIKSGLESSYYTSNNLYHYLGVPYAGSGSSNTRTEERGFMPQRNPRVTEEQLY